MKIHKSFNLPILSVFLLLWSLNALLILGEIGKYTALVLGFVILALVSFNTKKKKKVYNFLLISLYLFLGYILIGYINNHATLDILTIVFGFVCFALLNFGYILGKNTKVFYLSNTLLIYVLSCLSIISSIGIIKFYNSQEIVEVRNFTIHEVINPVSLAYTNGALFVLFYFLFVPYYQKSKLSFKVLSFINLILLILVVVMTQSKGAVLSISVVLLLSVSHKLKISNFKITHFVKLIFLLILIFFSLFILVNKFPFIQNKLEGTLSRFQLFFSFANDSEVDPSALERTFVYNKFVNDFNDVFFAGQNEYRPYPHNQFLEIFLRWGLFGMPIIIISIISIFKSIAVLYKSNNDIFSVIIISVFVFCWFQSMTSLSLEMNRMLWFGFGFVLGMPLQRNNKKLS